MSCWTVAHPIWGIYAYFLVRTVFASAIGCKGKSASQWTNSNQCRVLFIRILNKIHFINGWVFGVYCRPHRRSTQCSGRPRFSICLLIYTEHRLRHTRRIILYFFSLFLGCFSIALESVVHTRARIPSITILWVRWRWRRFLWWRRGSWNAVGEIKLTDAYLTWEDRSHFWHGTIVRSYIYIYSCCWIGHLIEFDWFFGPWA